MMNITLRGKLLIDSLYFVKVSSKGQRKLLVHSVLDESTADRTRTIIPIYVVDPKIQSFILENTWMDGCEVEIFGEFKIIPTSIKATPDMVEAFVELNSPQHHIRFHDISSIKQTRLRA
jgi:hypothetical protein